MKINGKEYYFDVNRQKYVWIAGGEVKIVEKEHLRKELFSSVDGDEKRYKQRLSENFFEKIEARAFEFDPHKPKEFNHHGFKAVNMFRPTPVMTVCQDERGKVKASELHKDSFFVDYFPHIAVLLNNLFTSKERMDYFINWLATALITKKKNRTAILLRGRQGTGKGVLWEQIIEHAVGGDYCATIGNDDLTTNFNSALENKLFILANEIKGDFRDGNSMYEKLKMYVTDEELRIEQKRVDSRKVKNFFNVILNSNNATPLQIQGGDRRYTVYETSDIKLKDLVSVKFDMTMESFIKAIQRERDDFLIELFKFDYDSSLASQVQETEEKERIYRSSVKKTEILAEKIQLLDDEFFDNDLMEIVDAMNFSEFKELAETFNLPMIDDDKSETFEFIKTRMFAQIREFQRAETSYLNFFFSLFTGETNVRKTGTSLTALFGKAKPGKIGTSKTVRYREVKMLSSAYPF